MKTRSVQETCGSRWITLPRQWVEKQRIMKGDAVIVIEDDECLRVMPIRTEADEKDRR